VHCAFAGGLVQLLGDKPELFTRCFGVTAGQGRLKMLGLRFYLAFACAINRSSFGVLSDSFFG
jgi:hypothetical protein